MRMEVGDEATKHLSKTFRDSLPTTGTVWSYILGKMNSAGRLAEEGANASIPHLKKAGRLAEQGVNASLLHLKMAGSLAEQGVNASLPHLKKVGGMAEQGVKSAAAFTEDGVRATLLYVRTSLDYLVEKAMQHPYLFGSLALIILFRSIMIPVLTNLSSAVKKVLCKLFRGGSGLPKTMKAPGQNIRIPRAPFELNPKAYFSALRALKGK